MEGVERKIEINNGPDDQCGAEANGKTNHIDEGKQFVHGEKFVAFHQVIEPDVGVLLRGFKEFRDTHLLFDSKITVSAQKAVEFAALQ